MTTEAKQNRISRPYQTGNEFSHRNSGSKIFGITRRENIKSTQNNWTDKEAEIQEDFIWGIGPEALNQMTRAEYKTEPDKIAVKDLIRLSHEYFLPQRNSHHNRGELFWKRRTRSEKHPKISGLD